MVQVHVATSNATSNQPKHTPKVGWFVYILSTMAVISGFLFGYDTGIVSAAMLYVPQNGGMKPMDSLWHELVIAVTPGFAGLAALPAGPLSDMLGRKIIILLSGTVFTIGSIVCGVAFAKWFMLIGRILLGIAIGFSSMTVPVYIGESCPAHIRGRLVTSFQLMICFGQVFANVIGGAFSYISPENVGWRLMFLFAAIPSVIQFVGFLFLPESPRNLYEKGRKDECDRVLKMIYNGDEAWSNYEYEEIKNAHEEHEKSKNEKGGGGFVLWQILKTPHVRKALIIGFLLQGFQQLAGINTIMYYTANIIRSAGIKDDHSTIWISVGTSCVIFAGVFIPIFLVERIGRRWLLLSSVAGVLISLVLMGGGFLAINMDSAITSSAPNTSRLFDTNVENYEICSRYRNCDFCVTDERCGFCSIEGQKTGYCLPKDHENPSTLSTTGFCSIPSSDNYHRVNSSGEVYEWADVYCQTKYTAWPIIVMVIYLAFFGAGYAPLTWVLNSEFYPLWARGTAVSITTFSNWLFNLIISITFLSLSQGITKYGAFFLYAGITLAALVIFFIWVPETKGLGIDEVEMLFMTKKARNEVKQKLDKNGNHMIELKGIE